jgi:hypothetical protein
MTPAMRHLASTLLLVGLLAGCGGPNNSRGSQGSQAHLAGTSTASQPVTQTRVRSFPDGEACPPTKDSRVPADSGCLSSRSGDFDGDGRTDQWLIYAHPLDAAGQARAWHSRIILASGTVLNSRVPNPGSGTTVWIVGVTDANNDGKDDAFIRVNAGAATDTVGIFYIAGGRISRVVKGREPLAFSVGGVVLFGNGARCQDINGDGRLELVLTGVSSNGGHHYHWAKRAYEWRGHALSPLGVRRGVIDVRGPADSGRVDPFYVLRCGTVFLS